MVQGLLPDPDHQQRRRHNQRCRTQAGSAGQDRARCWRALIAPWLICDYTGRDRDIKSPLFRILGFVSILFCFGMQFMDQRPPTLMVVSQAFQACILPAVVIPIFIMINRTQIMAENVANKKTNIGLTLVFLFSLLTTYCAIIEFIAKLKEFF